MEMPPTSDLPVVADTTTHVPAPIPAKPPAIPQRSIDIITYAREE